MQLGDHWVGSFFGIADWGFTVTKTPFRKIGPEAGWILSLSLSHTHTHTNILPLSLSLSLSLSLFSFPTEMDEVSELNKKD